MAADEFFGSGAGEHAGRRADGAHAACPHGAGELQAVELGAAFEQADDVPGVEGVAAAGAVDERDGIGAELDAKLVRNRDHPALAARDHHPACTHVMKRQGLADGVALSQDQLGLVGVGNEDVGVRQHDLERLEIVSAGPASPRRAT